MEYLHSMADATTLHEPRGPRKCSGEAAGKPTVAFNITNGPLSDIPERDEDAMRFGLFQTDYNKALATADSILPNCSRDLAILKHRARTLLDTSDATGAARAAAEAVILDRTDPEAQALLGIALFVLGFYRDASTCLSDAIKAVPTKLVWRQTLSAALLADSRNDEAIKTLKAGLAIAPTDIDLRNTVIINLLRIQEFEAALDLAGDACAQGIGDACTLSLRGHALASIGRHDEAAISYAEALKFGSADPYIQYLASAAGLLPSIDRAPLEYVAAVFDGCAERFEIQLSALAYSVPFWIRETLGRHPAVIDGCGLGSMLDLGCGTGLVGLSVSDMPVGSITGVDLSLPMLMQACLKGVYTELYQNDISVFMEATTDRQWPLITAGDVLVYFGLLDSIATSLFSGLAQGGWLIFTIELLQVGDEDWQLHRSGRYAHSLRYIDRTLKRAGFRAVSFDIQPIRVERGNAVQGAMVVAEHP